MSTSNQSPQEERFSSAFPLELKILFLVFPATFETRQSGGMEMYDNTSCSFYLWYLLNA
jgi:hypothetical protein